MDFFDGADDAILHQFDRASESVLGRTLVAHLGADTVLAGLFHQHARFEDGLRQRLLTVDVLAHPDRHDRRQGVSVVGRADEDGVDLFLHRLKQLAEVVKDLCRGPLLDLRSQVPFVDVAKCDDLTELAGLVDVAAALPADANAGESKRFVRLASHPGSRIGRCRVEVAEGRGPGPEESASVHARSHWR